jgi:uncharacterized protein YjdB
MKRFLILTFTTLIFFAQSSLAQCSGLPAAGTITASQSSSCAPFVSNLSLSGASSGPGIVYQWMSSPDGIAFSPIIGATNTTYVAPTTVTTYYNAIITCTSNGISVPTPDITLTVNSIAANTGSGAVCAGFSTDLDNATPGGIWGSSNTAAAVVNSTTGVVTGIAVGTSAVSYTTGPGCISTTIVTVSSLPAAITGIPTVCQSSTVTLTDSDPGGTWTSSNPAIASAALGTGEITGVAAGNVNITYTLSTGCYNIKNITVNPLPSAIAGASSVCAGATTNFTDGTPGGAWTSGNPVIANVGLVTGVVTGLAAGTATISYTLVLTGCSATKNITVNLSPTPIIGSANVCIGLTDTLSDAIVGGGWSSSNTTVATVGTSGVVTGVAFGTSVISYTLPTGSCNATKTVTVQPLPSVHSVTGGGSYCFGGTGVNIGLDNSDLGITYTAYIDTAAFIAAGTGSPLDFGLITAGGVYSVVATNATTGCRNNMSGTATVTITPLTAPAVSVSTGIGDSICEGTLTTFTPLPFYGGTAPIYDWRVNGVLVSSSATYTFVPADGDSVNVVMTSNAACPSPDTATGGMTITVLEHVMPAVNVTIAPSDTVCQGTLVNYTALPVYGGAAPFYQWQVNGILEGTGVTFTYEPLNGDIVTARMASNYQCRLADTVISNNVNMNVVPIILPFVNITSIRHLNMKYGELDTLTANVINAGPSPTFQWLVNDSIISGATSSVFISSFNHYDSVSCIVTSSGLCSGITTYDWVFITITNVGVPSLATITDVQLLPNPNNGAFTVKGHLSTTADEAVILEVTDMLGQVVYRNNAIAKGGKISEQIVTSNTLANGMYMLSVRTASENKVFHFVVEQ